MRRISGGAALAITLLAALAAALAGGAGRAAGQVGTPLVRVQPAAQDAGTGTTFTVTVVAEAVTALGGYQLSLTYDPQVVQCLEAATTDWLGSTGRNLAPLGPEIDNSAGVVTLGAFSYGSVSGPSGRGDLAVFRFHAAATPGSSLLTPTSLQLIDSTGSAMNATAAGGGVTVLAGPRITVSAGPAEVRSDRVFQVSARISDTIHSDTIHSDTIQGAGVAGAELRYGYSAPYAASTVAGSGPGGTGNGVWTFSLPAQGPEHEGQTLKFSLAAWDVAEPAGMSVDDRGGAYYALAVLDDDTSPPAFSAAGPDVALAGFPVTLRVDIADTGSGVREAGSPGTSPYVLWDNDGELAMTAQRAELVRASGTTFVISPSLPALPAGASLVWRAYAEDRDNSPAGAWSPQYTTAVIAPLAEDFNYDCVVDAADLSLIAPHWGREDPLPAAARRFDLDGDGDVDVLDVQRTAGAWGTRCSRAISPGAARTGDAAAGDRHSGAEGTVGGVLSFQPEVAYAAVGQPLTLTIRLDGAAGLGGFEFRLHFDPQYISVTQITPGGLLRSTGNQTGELGPRPTGAGGLAFGGYSYGSQSGPADAGVLAQVAVKLLQEGESQIELQRVQIATRLGGPLTVGQTGNASLRTGASVYLPLLRR